MKTQSFSLQVLLYSFIVSALIFQPIDGNGQRMPHRGGGGVGNRGASSRPATHNRPSTPSRPASTPQKRSINGGSQLDADRGVRQNRSSSGGQTQINNRDNAGRNATIKDNTARRDDNNTNIGKGGNKVNIDNSKRNVNINVDNSKNINVNNNRNTVVRRNNINTYNRPPYRYGGRSYYCYHPYFYHPYRPFYWGPVWHPWGFFVATLAVTAIVVSVNNAQYHYDQGVWYEPSNYGYTVVQAPVGGTVTTIPSGYETVVVNNTTNYYYGGAYYEKDGTTYKVVAPPAGAVIEKLPEGGEEVRIGDQTYVKVGETYYQPVEGNKYEVVQIEEGS
ncbi:hypothetical protein D3C80_899080 [compost metagenome]